ncbi:hypothetical protein NHL50_02670 [Acidimicrobiia bacterium EGI L10123]|uniref:hypothetical protein n=1 Tax=Salinilacustrithrix flava TaxID=2957203 RepID=UPI003D7C2B18|nr:hypothetical protein [Acidimicrobiia bacterium EGI L10123]
MTHPTTQHHDPSEVDADDGADSRDAGSVVRRRPGLVSLLAGGAGVVVATLPGLGLLALALAALAIASGVPAMRKGPGAASFSKARTGVVLGMIAVLLGVISLAMQLLA